MKFVGGCLCLDFVNTVGGRDAGGAVIRDKIASLADLQEWSVLAGTIKRSTAPPETEAALNRARNLREALYRIFHRIAIGKRIPLPDMKILQAEVSAARSSQVLFRKDNHFAWAFPDRTAEADRILWPIALSAAQLLTSSDLSQVKQCPGDQCGWLFLDLSRNGRRQWCEMRDCGNRAKVRRFRAKRI